MDSRRFAIKEALMGEAAVAAQGVTKDSRYLTAEQMLAELDKIFMPKQESALAKREFAEYKQQPVQRRQEQDDLLQMSEQGPYCT
ncbi:MAG: hypothetical protein GY696_38645 [Gammaproteobacteria bacterium]|nr:hypothetical protein [Gammaproteobacteria bacterium]